MRLTRLLLVVLLVLVIGRTAAGQEIKANNQNSVQAPPDYVLPAQNARSTPQRDFQTERNGFGNDGTPRQDVCLTMHSLIVERSESYSDTTRLVAQRTCTPAVRFQMKSAVVEKK